MVSNEKRANITIQKLEPISHGRVRVKILERNISLNTMRHENKNYIILKQLGRGRFIAKEVV